ncbi:MAG TPA: acylphosphatase [Ardenticatenaceae bacterium]|jgi:acylphosphatase
MGTRRVHLFVTGSVQGVFFRASTREVARQLGLNGFARNLPDGRVEIVAEGGEEGVQRLIAWARTGPPHAHVAHIEVHHEEATGQFEGFSFRH